MIKYDYNRDEKRCGVDMIDGMIEDALRATGIRFITKTSPVMIVPFDFYLVDYDVYIKFMQFHSPRIAEEMAMASNVIAIQGRPAAELFCNLLGARGGGVWPSIQPTTLKLIHAYNRRGRKYSLDIMEHIIEKALCASGIRFTNTCHPAMIVPLDFYLVDNDVYIEVKQFHSPRIAKQMAQASNIITIQGRPAVEWFCNLLEAGGRGR